MPNVYLKDGRTVQVSIEELEDYLYENEDHLEIRHVERRGSRRDKVALGDKPVSSASSR